MLDGFENAVKSGQTAKTGTHCRFRNGNIGLNQQGLCVKDSFLGQIFIAGDAGELFKQSGKMEFGKAGEIGERVNIDIFRAMVGYVVADVHEFFNIFMLLAGSNAGEFFAGIEISTAYGNKKMNDQ